MIRRLLLGPAVGIAHRQPPAKATMLPIALAIVALAIPQSRQHPVAGPSTVERPKIERGSDENPLTVKVVPPTQTEKQSADERNDREERMSADRWTRDLGLATVVLAMLSVLVYLRQASLLRQSIGTMDRIARSQADDMAKSIAAAMMIAEATQTVANVARDSARAQATALAVADRARLGPTGWNVEQFSAIAIVLSCRLRNSGRTPATVERGELTFSYWDGTVPGAEEEPATFTVGFEQARILGGSDREEFFWFPAPAEHVLAVWGANHIAMRAGGWVQYRDAFEGTPLHVRYFSVAKSVGTASWGGSNHSRDEEDDGVPLPRPVFRFRSKDAPQAEAPPGGNS